MKPHSDTIGYDPSIELYIVDANGNEYGVSLKYEGEWAIHYYQYPSIEGHTSFSSCDLDEVLHFMDNNLTPNVFKLIDRLIESIEPYKHLIEVNPTWWKD